MFVQTCLFYYATQRLAGIYQKRFRNLYSFNSHHMLKFVFVLCIIYIMSAQIIAFGEQSHILMIMLIFIGCLVAQWLRRWIRDREVASSTPSGCLSE